MTTRPKLTSTEWSALADAGRGPLYHVGATSRWAVYGSPGRHSDRVVGKLIAHGYIEAARTSAGTPMRRITQAGRQRLGWKSPGPPSDTDAAARAAAALHERIAP